MEKTADKRPRAVSSSKPCTSQDPPPSGREPRLWVPVLAPQDPRRASHRDKARKGCDFHPFVREADPDPWYLKMTNTNSTDISAEWVICGADDGEKDTKVALLGEDLSSGEEKGSKQPRYGGGANGVTQGVVILRPGLQGQVRRSQADKVGQALEAEGQELPVGGACAQFRGAQGSTACSLAHIDDHQNLENCGRSG